jgi:zinc protease
MMFRGTKKHPAAEYRRLVAEQGLDSNASTSEDKTTYFLYGPAKALPTIIELEADRFQNLDYSEAEFRTEAGAILGEYAKNASNPEQRLREKMRETAFQRHTYRHTTMGYLADIKAMPEGYTYSREFFSRYYRPDNTLIVISGDFDRAKTLALLRKHYGGWKGKARPAPIAAEPPQAEARRASVDWPSPTLPRVWLAWHTPGGADLKAAAVQTVLSAYLFGPTSALYQRLVLEQQVVDSLEEMYWPTRDAGLFGVIARAKDAERTPQIEEAIAQEVAALAQGKVDAKKMSGVRSHLKYANALALDTPKRAGATLARFAAVTGDVQWLNKLHAQIDALKPADLAAFAKKHLVDAQRTTVTLATRVQQSRAGGEQ